jgi:hypothetical protein
LLLFPENPLCFLEFSLLEVGVLIMRIVNPSFSAGAGVVIGAIWLGVGRQAREGAVRGSVAPRRVGHVKYIPKKRT